MDNQEKIAEIAELEKQDLQKIKRKKTKKIILVLCIIGVIIITLIILTNYIKLVKMADEVTQGLSGSTYEYYDEFLGDKYYYYLAFRENGVVEEHVYSFNDSLRQKSEINNSGKYKVAVKDTKSLCVIITYNDGTQIDKNILIIKLDKYGKPMSYKNNYCIWLEGNIDKDMENQRYSEISWREKIYTESNYKEVPYTSSFYNFKK